VVVCGGVLNGDCDTLALLAQLVGIVQCSASRHLHGDLPGPRCGSCGHCLSAVRGVCGQISDFKSLCAEQEYVGASLQKCRFRFQNSDPPKMPPQDAGV
jgi:hypothetical protein